jgi:uncharacterized protein YjbI with pentapeptide repeats
MMVMLVAARREILQLAVAIGAEDEDSTAVAAARLTWALGVAEQLAATCPPPRLEAMAPGLHRVRTQATRWLLAAPHELSVAALQRIVAREQARRSLGEPGIEATDAHLEGLDLDDVPLSICLRDATLADVTARRALMYGADASGASFRECRFYACSMRLATFDDASFEECDLSRTNLDCTSWRGATISRCTLLEASIVDAHLEGAAFIDCDLRGAAFDVLKPERRLTSRGLRFVRCDLRDTSWCDRDVTGVSFKDCKIGGGRGAPFSGEA